MTMDDMVAMMTAQGGLTQSQIDTMSALGEDFIKNQIKEKLAPNDADTIAARDEFVLNLIIMQQTEAQFEEQSDATIAAALDEKIATADDATLLLWFKAYMPEFISDSTYEDNLITLGAADLETPSSINIYPVDFAAKERIAEIIEEYNVDVGADATKGESYKISYTDYIGLFMSSISTIINTISIVLIAFVGISLVVSSIMIGIITYISVLERTKEIGILRSIGASKHDISRVFNAETIIIGFIAGLFGILITVLLDIPVNIIINAITDIPNVSQLPIAGAILLVAISVALTFVAGLIPSKIAAKKDPVVALRTE